MKNHQNQKEEKFNQGTIDYYFDKNRFIQLLLKTKKYKELFLSKEALVSVVLSAFLAIMLVSIGTESVELKKVINIPQLHLTTSGANNVVELVRTLLITSIAAMFGLLGFLISGLSILSATISTKVINTINEKGKIDYLIRIMFSFYFTGGLLGITIIASIFSYTSTYFNVEMTSMVLGIWSFSLGYITLFTIITCTMLLGTSMRFFLLNYWYYREEQKKVLGKESEHNEP